MEEGGDVVVEEGASESVGGEVECSCSTIEAPEEQL